MAQGMVSSTGGLRQEFCCVLSFPNRRILILPYPEPVQHLKIFKNTQSLEMPMGSRDLLPPGLNHCLVFPPQVAPLLLLLWDPSLQTSLMPTTATHDSCSIKSCSYPLQNTLRIVFTFLELAREDQLSLEQLQTTKESQMRLRPPAGS